MNDILNNQGDNLALWMKLWMIKGHSHNMSKAGPRADLLKTKRVILEWLMENTKSIFIMLNL